jgi:hypothetical protein
MELKIKQPLFLLGILLISALACQALPNLPSEPTNVSVEPTAIPSETLEQPNMLLEDSFDDPASGFLSLRDEEGITDYEQGGYRIKVDKPEWFFWVESGKAFTDVTIDVDARKIGGPDNNEYGVICRYQDENNFYFFTVTSDGYYGVSKQLEDEISLIGMTELKSSSAINKADGENHITVVCDGNKLQFTVNGTLLAELEDDTFTSGDIGMIAASGEEPGTDILFDNLVVTSP